MKCQKCELDFHVFDLSYGLCAQCLNNGMKGPREYVYNKQVEPTGGKGLSDNEKHEGNEYGALPTISEGEETKH